MRIATLVPTYKRADKLEKFASDFHKNSVESNLYFIITPDDTESRDELLRLGETFLTVEGEYVSAINYGFDMTSEEFVCCASDDVVFNKGWDTTLLEMAKDTTKHIFGGIDEWKVSRTLKHISHPLIRRSHFRSPLYYPEYIHYMCDVEFIQRGWKEDCVMVAPELLIEHPHTFEDGDDPTKWDSTYKKSFAKINLDKDLYDRRKAEFEMWDFDDLKEGRVVPTKLNPIYNETLISIIIPTFNDYEFLKQCLQSIVNNTFYRYELIIINDHSDDKYKLEIPGQTLNYREFLDGIELEDKSCSIRVVHNDEQKWINYNWNMGAVMAKGQYLAFLNADIELSQDWDKYLVSALENPARKFTVASPYEINPHTNVPFSLDKWFMKHVPHMLKGPCFMLRKSDVPFIFPIPSQMKHWCGDNWIADKANAMGGVVYARKAVIFHYITQSGNKIKKSKISSRTYKDILAYEKLTGKNMNWIKTMFPEVIQDYCLADEDE